jgi:hypothetical protein
LDVFRGRATRPAGARAPAHQPSEDGKRQSLRLTAQEF